MDKRRFLTAAAAAAMVPAYSEAATSRFSITASNSGAQGAAPLRFGINVILPTPGPGYSVTLPMATGLGSAVEVVTRSLEFIVIYPPIGSSISFFEPNIGYAIYPGTALRFIDTGPKQWDMIFNVPSNYPVLIQIAARVGGGQPNAQPLAYGSNVIEKCANPGDSILLPIALGAGAQCFITNHGAATCAIYPRSGGRINTLSADTPYMLPASKVALFVDVGPPNQWDGGALS